MRQSEAQPHPKNMADSRLTSGPAFVIHLTFLPLSWSTSGNISSKRNCSGKFNTIFLYLDSKSIVMLFLYINVVM